MCAADEPRADGPFQFGVKFGNAILDWESLGTAAVHELPRGDPELTGEVLDFDALLGHGRILGYSIAFRFMLGFQPLIGTCCC